MGSLSNLIKWPIPIRPFPIPTFDLQFTFFFTPTSEQLQGVQYGWVDFKELLLLRFLVEGIFPHHSSGGKGVHFYVWYKKFFTFSKCYDLAQFSNMDLAENLKMS